ncbi:hypothetical protein ACTXKF_20025, partial [Vreelandella alkaliphila]|uniref:hypothetical protein n=2 Tax=Gammaproteobacteria TaxID=1236 RepID=UPI003FD77E5E
RFPPKSFSCVKLKIFLVYQGRKRGDLFSYKNGLRFAWLRPTITEENKLGHVAFRAINRTGG